MRQLLSTYNAANDEDPKCWPACCRITRKGAGGRVGWGGGRVRIPRGGNDEYVNELNGKGDDQGMGANGGVKGVNRNVKGVNGGEPDFSTIIAQQLQNLLPTMLAQVGNQGNVGNQMILVLRSSDVYLVRSISLFKHKFYVDGTLSRYKARLGANGSTQHLGVDFDETFSLVVKPVPIRIVLSLVVSRHWPIHQLDVNNAFFNDHLSKTGSYVAYLLIYVDDINLTASSSVLLQQIIDSLYKEFDMTYLGAHNYFLGISTSRHSTGLFLSHKKYALQLLESAHMVNCKPSWTLVSTNAKFSPNRDAPLLTGLLQIIMCFWEITFCHGPLNDNTPYPVVVPKQNIEVLLTFAVYMYANPVQHQRMKHIEIDIHFIRDMVTAGYVYVLHVPSHF
ncbi:ribonuclease H-like domain-containing protein [Tanacetum coccineum]